MKKILFVLATLLALAGKGVCQQQINPVTQINWGVAPNCQTAGTVWSAVALGCVPLAPTSIDPGTQINWAIIPGCNINQQAYSPKDNQCFSISTAGNITGITAGTGLLGGGTSGVVSIAVDPSATALLNGTNPFTTSQAFSAGITGTTAALTGAISGASVAATGAVSGASVAATGAVTGASGSFTGNVQGQHINNFGTCYGQFFAASSAITTGMPVVLTSVGVVPSGVTGAPVQGVAQSSVAAGANVDVCFYGTTQVTMDATSVAGNIAIAGSTSGQAHDSGQTSSNNIGLQTGVLGLISVGCTGSPCTATVIMKGAEATGRQLPTSSISATGPLTANSMLLGAGGSTLSASANISESAGHFAIGDALTTMNSVTTTQLNQDYTVVPSTPGGTWAGALGPATTSYPACTAGTYNSQTYISGAVTTVGHIPATTVPYNEWIPVPNTTSYTPYGSDCAWAAAMYSANTTGVNSRVLFSSGLFNTASGFQQQPSGPNQPTVGITCVGPDASQITLTQTIPTWMVALNQTPGGNTANTSNFIGCTYNANAHSQGIFLIQGQRRSKVVQNNFLNPNGNLPAVQIGAVTCTSGYYCNGDQITFAENWISGGGKGPSVTGNDALFTISLSGGATGSPSAAVNTGTVYTSTQDQISGNVITFTIGSNTLGTNLHFIQITGGGCTYAGLTFPVSTTSATTVSANYTHANAGPTTETCTVTDYFGGSFRFNPPVPVLSGFYAGAVPCSQSGTITPTMAAFPAPSTSFYATGATFGGTWSCGVGNGIDLKLWDVPPGVTYGLFLGNTTDSFFYKNIMSGIGTIAAIYNDNGENVWLAMHPDDNIINIMDVAGAYWRDTDCDSAQYQFYFKSSGAKNGRVDACHMYYDSSTHYVHAATYLFDNSVTNLNLGPDNISTQSNLNADYYAFVNNGTNGTGSGAGPIYLAGSYGNVPAGPTGALISGFLSLGSPEPNPQLITNRNVNIQTPLTGNGSVITLNSPITAKSITALAISTPISAPTGTPGATGAMTAATIYSKIVAVDVLGNTTSVGPEASATVDGSTTHSIAWTWTAINNAISYQIWVGTATNTENSYFTSTTASYTQTANAGTAGTAPNTNSTGPIVAGAANFSGTVSASGGLSVVGNGLFQTGVRGYASGTSWTVGPTGANSNMTFTFNGANQFTCNSTSAACYPSVAGGLAWGTAGNPWGYIHTQQMYNDNAGSGAQTCGTGPGTVTFWLVASGAAERRYILWMSNCVGSYAYTLPLNFTHTPNVETNSISSNVTANTTTITVNPASSTTGYVVVIGN